MTHLERHSPQALAALVLCIATTSQAVGTALPDEPLQRRCWLEQTAMRTAVDLREPTSVRFSNLKNGYTVRSPFWIEFGIRGMGVIPAGNPNQRAGHHHLLVDTPLPANHTEKIPFSDTHKHFGKGQTGTALDLKPGKHTLRLLFADHDHRPYFVYSPEITIEVVGKRDGGVPVIDANQFESTCARWYQDEVSTPRSAAKEVYVKNLRDGEPVRSPFVISLGVAGYGVAPSGSTVKDTGRFVLNVVRAKAPVSRIDLADGRTETVLDLPRGDYELELSFVGTGETALLKAAPMHVSVVKSGL
jgi:hypothetical protein